MIGPGLLLSALLVTLAPEKDPLEGHPGIVNYFRIRPDVATAGQPNARAFEAIREAGFQTILNLRTPEEGSLEERAAVEDLGLQYVNIPIGAGGIRDEHVERFAEILADPARRPILIHCASSNRVGALWYIHQVLVEGADESTALAEAKKAGLSSLERHARKFVERRKPSR